MKKDNKKALYESIMASVAKEVKKALNEEYVDEDDCEWITYEDILDAMENVDPQEIIDDDGQSIEDYTLDNIMYPENGAEIASTAVQLAEQMFENNWSWQELYNYYSKNDMLEDTI